MIAVKESILKKGYVPLAVNSYGGISWQGAVLKNFWMWNRQYNEYEGGIKHIQTVKVTELSDAAIRYWRDKWVPVAPIDETLLRRMESSLRSTQARAIKERPLPPDEFLDFHEAIPVKYLGPEVRELLGMKRLKSTKLVLKKSLPSHVIESYKRTKG